MSNIIDFPCGVKCSCWEAGREYGKNEVADQALVHATNYSECTTKLAEAIHELANVRNTINLKNHLMEKLEKENQKLK